LWIHNLPEPPHNRPQRHINRTERPLICREHRLNDRDRRRQNTLRSPRFDGDSGRDAIVAIDGGRRNEKIQHLKTTPLSVEMLIAVAGVCAPVLQDPASRMPASDAQFGRGGQ
jgi:hypothetical protein